MEAETTNLGTIQAAFTEQSQRYASNPIIADVARWQRLVAFAGVNPGAIVLDVASGPGYLALAAAEAGARAVALDATPAMLQGAGRRAAERALTVAFVMGDAARLPFDDGCFDVVSCGSAFHHFAKAEEVAAQMARVCRRGGAVVIEDVVSSEDPDAARRHNHIERLRDPSHTTALAPSQLRTLAGRLGLLCNAEELWETPREVEEWLAISQPGEQAAAEVRRLMAEAVDGDGAGFQARREGSRLCFTHTLIRLRARKP